MSNIAKAFAGGKAFIPFITCGDPDLATTAAAVRAMAANGADLIELGIPFSDPTAEGPVIQGANIRALKAGTTTDKVFDLVREVRRDVTIPMVFMTYANVVFSYGAEKFISTCAEIGIDGLILPDLPYEEKDEFLPICRKYGVDLISMIAPTSENRIAMIAKEAEGFLYIVSSLGGRVAEQLILDDISTGASNDLQQATNIARQMITKYGFSERLGPVVYGTSQEETFLGRDLGQGKGYSETTAAEIDSEMRDIIDEAYETCRRTLTEHIDQLHALAQALMEREKLNEKEFNAVMAGETLPQREDPDAKPAEDQPAVQPVEQAETAEAAEPAEPAEPAEAVDAAPQEAPAPETPDEGEANQ